MVLNIYLVPGCTKMRLMDGSQAVGMNVAGNETAIIEVHSYGIPCCRFCLPC